MKTNFRKSKPQNSEDNLKDEVISNKELTQAEFEDFIIKSGSKGSFMIYRSQKKDDELGLDEL